MRVIAKSTLRQFWEQPEHMDAKKPLECWHEEVLKAVWQSPADIKRQYANASFIGSHRVVFNIAGNKYRLVAEMQYRAQIAWVKFIGTHAQYDKINVAKVSYEKN